MRRRLISLQNEDPESDAFSTLEDTVYNNSQLIRYSIGAMPLDTEVGFNAAREHARHNLMFQSMELYNTHPYIVENCLKNLAKLARRSTGDNARYLHDLVLDGAGPALISAMSGIAAAEDLVRLTEEVAGLIGGAALQTAVRAGANVMEAAEGTAATADAAIDELLAADAAGGAAQP